MSTKDKMLFNFYVSVEKAALALGNKELYIKAKMAALALVGKDEEE